MTTHESKARAHESKARGILLLCRHIRINRSTLCQKRRLKASSVKPKSIEHVHLTHMQHVHQTPPQCPFPTTHAQAFVEKCISAFCANTHVCGGNEGEGSCARRYMQEKVNEGEGYTRWAWTCGSRGESHTSHTSHTLGGDLWQ